MKKTFFFLTIALICSCSEINEKEPEITASISLDYNKRIIYEMIDNLVSITPSNGKHDNIIVKVNNEIVKGPKFEDYYPINHNKVEDILLEVFYIDRKSGEERKIAESRFSVQEMPTFEPYFAYHPPGSIVSKDIFTPERTLNVKIPTSPVMCFH